MGHVGTDDGACLGAWLGQWEKVYWHELVNTNYASLVAYVGTSRRCTHQSPQLWSRYSKNSATCIILQHL